jgi:hypothetical protein
MAATPCRGVGLWKLVWPLQAERLIVHDLAGIAAALSAQRPERSLMLQVLVVSRDRRAMSIWTPADPLAALAVDGIATSARYRPAQ